jgi:hypothetical protein
VLLAFCDEAARRERLLRFASWLEGGSGITTLVSVVEADGPRARQIRNEEESALRAEIESYGLPAFPRAIATRDLDQAMPVLLQAYGLGPVRANTVLFNWFDRKQGDTEPYRMRKFVRRLRLGLHFGCNLVVLSAGAHDFELIRDAKRGDRRIDVWHRDNATGRLSLLLAYLMTRSETWKDARIRWLAPLPSDRTREEALAAMERTLEEVRIAADAEIVEDDRPRTVVKHSAGSSVVLLPMTVADDRPSSAYGPPEQLLPELGLTALVLACQDIALDAEPEGGEHGEIAHAVDEAEKASKAERKTAREAERAAEEEQKARERLDAARQREADDGSIAELEAAVRVAEEEAERLRRRAAKAQAKAEAAEEEAEQRTGKTAPTDRPDGHHD